MVKTQTHKRNISGDRVIESGEFDVHDEFTSQRKRSQNNSCLLFSGDKFGEKSRQSMSYRDNMVRRLAKSILAK